MLWHIGYLLQNKYTCPIINVTKVKMGAERRVLTSYHYGSNQRKKETNQVVQIKKKIKERNNKTNNKNKK